MKIKEVIIKDQHIKVEKFEFVNYRLVINDTYKLTNHDKVIYVCDECGKTIQGQYNLERYKEYYKSNKILCTNCARKEKLLKKYGIINVFQLKEVKEKTKQTSLKKYGTSHPYQNKQIQEKAKQTNLAKYGVENPFAADEIKEKIKKTNLKKYGIEYASQAPKIKEKTKQTLIEKYGAPTTFGSKIIREKIKQTNLKKYGVDNPLASSQTQQKIKQTMLKKYGVDNPLKSKEIIEKVWKTNIKKYGFTQPSKNPAVIEKIKKSWRNKMVKQIFDGTRVATAIPLFSPEEYKNNKTKLKWKCKKCGTVFEDDIYAGSQPRCPVCYPPLYMHVSQSQRELSKYIKNLGFSILENYRKLIPPKEVDIFIPEKNIAIEFDGIYWHSYPNKPKNYHLQKTQECMKKGVRLIHIFEDEWIYKEHIVKARLKAILGKNENIIGARKTVIQEIEAETKNLFLDNYHIQGADRAAIKLGAFYEDKLIGVMTFSKPRLALGQKERKEGHWELSRFATIPNTSTPGLASKMLKYFIEKYKPIQIYSYADIRWNTGKLYDKLGFKFAGITKPNYWYFDNEGRRYHRFNFRKNVIKEWVENGDKKTEAEIMNELGFFKMYDCGNYKFVIDF